MHRRLSRDGGRNENTAVLARGDARRRIDDTCQDNGGGQGCRAIGELCTSLARRPRISLSRWRKRLAQLAAIDDCRVARKSRPDRLLDLYLYQLAPLASLCPDMVREIQKPRTGGDWRPFAGI